MTTGNATEQVPANSTAQHSRNLLRSIYRRRRAAWTILAIVVFVASLLLGFFLFPQSYGAMTSLSISSSSSSSSPLAALTGGSNGKAKYLGPLKSRHFAEQVEKVVHLKELYHLQDEDEIIDKMQRAVRFDDNATDGLLYITASLDGPPKMAGNSAERRKLIENASADVANGYAQALKDYIAYNDTDKDSILLRSADSQLKQARADYDAAVDKWINFVRESKSPSIGSGNSPNAQSPELAALQALFIRRGQLEVQMKSADVEIAGIGNLVNKPNSQMSSMPTEDELLNEARRRYTEAQRDIQDLRIQYSDTAPPVLRAKERLKIAADHLHQQAEAILNGKTSENVKRTALQAEYDTVSAQITEAERNIQVSKRAATSFERLHAETELALRVLESTATKRAELKIQTVSSYQRVYQVDKARAPKRGKPGTLMVSVVSAFMAALAVLAWYGIEFMQRSSQQTNGSVEPASTSKKSEV